MMLEEQESVAEPSASAQEGHSVPDAPKLTRRKVEARVPTGERWKRDQAWGSGQCWLRSEPTSWVCFSIGGCGRGRLDQHEPDHNRERRKPSCKAKALFQGDRSNHSRKQD
jgi:hypothetical protein